MKLIFVHGINNQDNSASLIEETWLNALMSGAKTHGLQFPDNVDVTAAFYGDVLAEQTGKWNEVSAPSTGARSGFSSNTISEDHVAFYREFQSAFKVSDEQVSKYLPDGFQENPRAAGIHKSWLKAIARALEDLLPTRGRYVARVFLSQAAAYLQAHGLKGEIDAIVKQQVFDGIVSDQRTVVVAHSLGTVISYDLLRSIHGTNSSVNLFLTAGSPLGIKIVKKKLGQPLFKPDSIIRWVNASDSEDFVALQNKINRKTFGDVEVVNYSELDNGKEDAHDITKYLQHKEVIQEIIAALGQAS